MPSRRCKTDADLLKLQGGTGKHIDGDVNRPLAGRPFQALVQLTDAAASGSDGSLHVLPGFHVTASRFFHAAGATAPEGGFTPLSEYEDICHPDLWVAVRRMPPQWAKVHEKLPACGAAQARGREGMSRALRKLAAELRDERTMGRAEPVHTCSACACACAYMQCMCRAHRVHAMHLPAMQLPQHSPQICMIESQPGGACATQVRSGDYVLWDPRLPHTTGESDAFSRSSAPRQVLYCAFMLARDNDTQSAEQRACRKSGLHMSWSPSAQRYEEAGHGYEEAPLTPLGQARCGCMHVHCVYHAYAQHTPRTPPLTTTPYYGEALYGYSGNGEARRERGEATRVENQRDEQQWHEAENIGPPAQGPGGRGGRGGRGAARGLPKAADLLRAGGGSGDLKPSDEVDDKAGAVTAAHVAFFRRYGYVVVERALPTELVARVAEEVKAHLLKRHGVDLSDLRGSLSAARMQRAFSPDGSGMIELYWLAAMEEASPPPTTHHPDASPELASCDGADAAAPCASRLTQRNLLPPLAGAAAPCAPRRDAAPLRAHVGPIRARLQR